MNIPRTAMVFLLLGTLGSGPVSANSTNAQSLGTDLGDFDDWRLVCAAGAGAQARVQDRTAENLPGAPDDNVAALMHVTIWEFGAADEEIAGGEGSTSSWATLDTTGPGTYTVRFEKTAAGPEAYEGWAECIPPTVVPTSFSRTENN